MFRTCHLSLLLVSGLELVNLNHMMVNFNKILPWVHFSILWGYLLLNSAFTVCFSVLLNLTTSFVLLFPIQWFVVQQKAVTDGVEDRETSCLGLWELSSTGRTWHSRKWAKKKGNLIQIMCFSSSYDKMCNLTRIFSLVVIELLQRCRKGHGRESRSSRMIFFVCAFIHPYSVGLAWTVHCGCCCCFLSSCLKDQTPKSQYEIESLWYTP